MFGPSGEGYFRFALVPALEECERAAEILREVAWWTTGPRSPRSAVPSCASRRRSTANGA